MKLAPEPKYKALYSELKKEHDLLISENELLKDKVVQLSYMVETGKVGSIMVETGLGLMEVPKPILELMVEHNLPWQVFKCEEHDHWVTELDSLFPYHMENNKCDLCLTEEV